MRNGFLRFARLTFVALFILSACGPRSTPTASAIQVAETSAPATETPVPPTETLTSTIQPTTAVSTSGPTMIGKDGMTLLLVPAGEFSMGGDDGDADEKPIHAVNLDAFWIDQTEVTNAMYAMCVQDGKCNSPGSTQSHTHLSYYSNVEFDAYPVIYVDWNMAKTYCEWAGRRLPTEAEWEKAARGADANVYPWGTETPNANLSNYNNEVSDTTEVGTYPDGKSIYGILDMAGNVWEWVADWYDETYYQNSAPSNPTGPDAGQFRVLRGGGWSSYDYDVRSANRYKINPAKTDHIIGFRCAQLQ